MFVAILDNQSIPLIPLAEALVQTGLSEADLAGFSAGHFPTHPVWEDKVVTGQILEKLVKSIPLERDVSSLPLLPDQLALLLRTELTLLSTKYDFSADEKDMFEQQLQDVLRPLVYACIEKIVAGEQLGDGPALVGRLLGETIAIGWQTHESNGWQIDELESVLGPIGYRFKKQDRTVVAQGHLSAESAFFVELGEKFTERLG